MATLTANAVYDFERPDFSTPFAQSNGARVIQGTFVLDGNTYDSASLLIFGEGRIGIFGNNLQSNGSALTGGTAQVLFYGEQGGATNWKIVGFNAPAADLFRPFTTPSTADDSAVFKLALAGSDTVTGSGYSDNLVAWSSDDWITGGKGNDEINGGDGIDTAIFSGIRGDYTISFSAQGAAVSDKVAGRDGNDRLVDVERLRFADISVALDIDGNAGDLYRLYQAAFDRKPDAGGLGYWIKQVDAGASLVDVSRFFLTSSEGKSIYGQNISNSDFVNLLYQNVLHRPGEQSGVDFWTLALSSGASKEQVLFNFADSTENKAAVIGSIENGIGFHEYVG